MQGADGTDPREDSLGEGLSAAAEGGATGVPEEPDRLASVWAAAAAYLTGGEDEKRGLRAALDKLLQSEPSHTSTYVAKLTTQGYRNQVWQGRGNTEAHDVMLFLDQSGNTPGVRAAASGRLYPSEESGFDAVLVGRQSADGWEPSHVVEYEHSNFGASLRAERADVRVTQVPDPAPSRRVQRLSQTEPHVPEGSDVSVEDVLLHLDEAKNVVLAGPPGTGKTRLALDVVNELAQGDGDGCRLEVLLEKGEPDDPASPIRTARVVWEILQLHPAFTYEDFIRGQRTDPDAPALTLRTIDGVLPRMCRVAAVRGGKPVVLILDEINRANLPVVLGETIFAIDPAHRNQPVTLQYDAPPGGTDALKIPENLFVLATMNTADRSVASIDFAIRRRFRFLRMPPSRGAIERHYESYPDRLDRVLPLYDLLTSAVAEEELKLGHSYFIVQGQADLSAEEWARLLTDKMTYEVRPLLQEYLDEGRRLGPTTLATPAGDIDLLLDPADQAINALKAWLTPGADE